MSKLDDYIEKPKYEHLAKAYDALEAQLAACAAGPWRFDVENAPRDGSEVWGQFQWYEDDIEQRCVRWRSDSGAWDCYGEPFPDSDLRAFAVPNPPQVKQ